MKSIAVNAVSVDWPAAVGTAPDPPEAADARACANAVLPAPVGPTTAIALTTFADLLAGMSAHLPWNGRRRCFKAAGAASGLYRPVQAGRSLFHGDNKRATPVARKPRRFQPCLRSSAKMAPSTAIVAGVPGPRAAISGSAIISFFMPVTAR